MQRNIIRINNNVIVKLQDGTVLQKKMSDEEFKNIINMTDEELLASFGNEIRVSLSEIKKSNILTIKGDCAYWLGISGYSLPVLLIERILDAEKKNDQRLIQTYKNFWTLMSLNPDSRCRENLFWFLDRWGLTIEKSGFFLGYRNVNRTNEKDVYTDAHSHTTRIEIGKVVCMPREKCDCNQDHQCSTGLHVAGADWLTQGYYGEVGIAVLVNPADVVAVPCDADYGKLRTCAYLPIGFVKYNTNHNVIPYNVRDGFESEYVGRVIYEGLTNTDTDETYHLMVPTDNCLDKKGITEKVIQIALDCIKERTV